MFILITIVNITVAFVFTSESLKVAISKATRY